MATCKIIHTADWQLGKPFGRFPAEVSAALSEARLDAIDRLGKAQDLTAHRSGLLRLERIDAQGPALIRRLGAETAVVIVTLDLAGTYDEQPFEGAFAYSRVWHCGANDHWRVEAAHCSTAARVTGSRHRAAEGRTLHFDQGGCQKLSLPLDRDARLRPPEPRRICRRGGDLVRRRAARASMLT